MIEVTEDKPWLKSIIFPPRLSINTWLTAFNVFITASLQLRNNRKIMCGLKSRCRVILVKTIDPNPWQITLTIFKQNTATCSPMLRSKWWQNAQLVEWIRTEKYLRNFPSNIRMWRLHFVFLSSICHHSNFLLLIHKQRLHQINTVDSLRLTDSIIVQHP